ncbi:hypothetical protein J2Y42_000936 [Leifsonia sp. 1010]|nr:hypothetical protein [Leifsonia sp. 1010]
MSTESERSTWRLPTARLKSTATAPAGDYCASADDLLVRRLRFRGVTSMEGLGSSAPGRGGQSWASRRRGGEPLSASSWDPEKQPATRILGS